MRTCLFCDETKLTLEHVWPDWISKYLFGPPKKGRFTASRFIGSERTLDGKPFKSAALNHKARIVCEECNGGWMSAVETHSKPVLQPLLRGRTLVLDDNDLAILRAWIVLRAMILEPAGSSPMAVPFYTDQERRTFADIDFEGSLEPIDGTYIWAFHYHSPQWVARSHVINGGIHAEPGGRQAHRFQVITGFVGRFGFQILVARWPADGRRLELNSRAVRQFQPVTAMLCPGPAETVSWPPGGFYLGDNSYEPLLDRLVKPGLPLQRQRPRR